MFISFHQRMAQDQRDTVVSRSLQDQWWREHGFRLGTIGSSPGCRSADVGKYCLRSRRSQRLLTAPASSRRVGALGVCEPPVSPRCDRFKLGQSSSPNGLGVRYRDCRRVSSSLSPVISIGIKTDMPEEESRLAVLLDAMGVLYN